MNITNDIYFEKINRQIVDEKGILNVLKVLKSGFLSRPEGGVYVKEFQNKFSRLINKKHCFVTNSGTSALHAAIVSLNLKKGDEILLPALTFMADASVIIQEGVVPVFVDVSIEDFNINPQNIEKKITQKTRAIIVVHLYGKPAKMDEIMVIAKKHNLIVIEDCAQAIGAKYKEKTVGSFGDISCFSFYQTKHLVTGEGGLIATNSEKQAEVLRSILNNGIMRSNLEDYDFDHIGFNYQMTEMQAALGLRQLDRLTKQNQLRRRNAAVYRKYFADTKICFQSDDVDSFNVYCYLTALLPVNLQGKREEFISKVLLAHLPVKKQYPISLPETTICKSFQFEKATNTPIASEVSQRVFNLFVNPGLEVADIEEIALSILKIYQSLGGE